MEDRREPGAKRRRAEGDEVVIEVVALGRNDECGDTRPPRSAGRGARRRALPSGSLSHATTSRVTPAGGTKAERLPAESAAAATVSGSAVTMDSTVSSPLADQKRANTGMPESDGVAVYTAQRLAWANHICLGGLRRIQPGTQHAADSTASRAVPRTEAFRRTRVFPWTEAILRVGGDGGDQRGQPAHAAVVPVDQRGVEAQCHEAAALNAAGR